MSKWTDLLYDQSKFEKEGYEYIEFDNILGKNVIVCDYELYGETHRGVRVLIESTKNPGMKGFIATSAAVIVRTFTEKPDKIKELIKERVPLKFIAKSSANGYRYITIDDTE